MTPGPQPKVDGGTGGGADKGAGGKGSSSSRTGGSSKGSGVPARTAEERRASETSDKGSSNGRTSESTSKSSTRANNGRAPDGTAKSTPKPANTNGRTSDTGAMAAPPRPGSGPTAPGAKAAPPRPGSGPTADAAAKAAPKPGNGRASEPPAKAAPGRPGNGPPARRSSSTASQSGQLPPQGGRLGSARGGPKPKPAHFASSGSSRRGGNPAKDRSQGQTGRAATPPPAEWDKLGVDPLPARSAPGRRRQLFRGRPPEPAPPRGPSPIPASGPPTVAVGPEVSLGAATSGGVRRRIVHGRRTRRVVRKIDVWTVFKMSLLFYFCVFLVFMIAGVVLWNVAENFNVITSVEKFIRSLFDLQSFTFRPSVVFESSLLGGLVLVLVGTGTNVLASVIYNLISDVVGGVQFIVLEETPVVPLSMPATPPPAVVPTAVRTVSAGPPVVPVVPVTPAARTASS